MIIKDKKDLAKAKIKLNTLVAVGDNILLKQPIYNFSNLIEDYEIVQRFRKT